MKDGGAAESWLTLRIRALIALALVAIAIPLIGGVAAIRHVNASVEQRLLEGQQASARALASQVGRAFDVAVGFARALAHRPGLVRQTRERNASEQIRVLENAFGTGPFFHSLAIFDLDGRRLSSHPVALPDLPAGFFDLGPRGSLPAIPSGDDALVILREPVNDPAGPAVGTLVAAVSMRGVMPDLEQLRIGTTGRATLVDRTGRVLVTGEARRRATTVGAAPLRALIADRRQGTARYLGTVVGREEIAAVAPVAATDWSIMVTRATSEALAPVAQLRNALTIGLIVLVVVGAGIVFLLSMLFDRYERRLRERIDEAERLNAALDAFSGRAAHDLRSPLAVIRMASDQIAAGRDRMSEDSQVAFDMVRRQADRGLELVEGLLRFARASATPQREPVALKEIAEEAARDIDHLTVRMQARCPVVVADPIGLRQAITNLFINASRHGRSNGIAEVTIECEETSEGWHLVVADRGPGVAMDFAEQLFTPFERGSTSVQGAGLGLSIVAAVARAHGGRAWYEPRDGGGAEFHLLLPRPTDTVAGARSMP